ncbi:hypothetical protein ACFZA1_39395 [Streptomyces filipinensis]
MIDGAFYTTQLLKGQSAGLEAMPARNACEDFARRDQRTNTARSSSGNTG